MALDSDFVEVPLPNDASVQDVDKKSAGVTLSVKWCQVYHRLLDDQPFERESKLDPAWVVNADDPQEEKNRKFKLLRQAYSHHGTYWPIAVCCPALIQFKPSKPLPRSADPMRGLVELTEYSLLIAYGQPTIPHTVAVASIEDGFPGSRRIGNYIDDICDNADVSISERGVLYQEFMKNFSLLCARVRNHLSTCAKFA
jgi:hypothetical protein